MLDRKILDDISARISKLVSETPAADVEKNLHSLLQGLFSRLDLVTREEFDAQTQVLLRAREQLSLMESRLQSLEARQPGKD